MAGFRRSVRAARQLAPHPEISSFDISLLNDWITPAEFFFVRDHFPVPNVFTDGWLISIEGEVAAPYSLTYQELIQQARKDLVATIECAENPVGGGLISNAKWTGTGLGALINKAKPRSEARFVRLCGVDGYDRVVPLSKAKHLNTLAAFQMNGENLRVSHGFPVRVVVPGWYGMDSVKWLRRIELLAEGLNPTYFRRARAGAMEPISSMSVKAAFARPLQGATLFGRSFVLRGAAWAGENLVRTVEVSLDRGNLWHIARLLDVPRPYAWIRWEYPWEIRAPGEYELVVRASDDTNRAQPSQRSVDRLDDYELNGYQRVRVLVR